MLLLAFLSLSAQEMQTITVQGIERQVPAAFVGKQSRATATQWALIDTTKVRYVVGQGSNISYLVFCWNDQKGMDNMVWGYRWNVDENGNAPTGKAMLQAVAAADPRFYILLSTNTPGIFGGAGFDLNGNGNFQLDRDSIYEPDSSGTFRCVGSAFDGFTPVDSFDHWRSGWFSGYCSYYISANPQTQLAYCLVGFTTRKLANNSVDLWSFVTFRGAAAVTDYSYYFYAPAPGVGAYLPESITIPLSDSAPILPYYVDTEGDSVSSMSWALSGTDVISSISPAGGRSVGLPVLTNKMGDVDVTLTAQVGKENLTSNVCRVTVGAPATPLTSVSFGADTLLAGRNRTVPTSLTLLPKNATYTAVTYRSLNTALATVDSLSGEVKTGNTEGYVAIVAASACDESVADTLVLNIAPIPVASVQVDSVYTMEAGDIMLLPTATVLPDNADNTGVTYSVADPDVASIYQKNILAHKAGETTLTVTASDGNGATATAKLVVKEADHTPYGDYTDGTFIINEGWYGHDAGTMNYLVRGDSTHYLYRVYNRENPDNLLGNTACYGTVYGGKLYISSKQAYTDSNTGSKGGRLMVADARTLKQQAIIENIGGGDGRAIVGVSPSKVYLGSSKGIAVFNAESLKVEGVVEGTATYISNGRETNAQIGDMVKVGKYVFAAGYNQGVLVIDANADTLVTVMANTGIQGIVQSKDGKVWVASSTQLDEIDPVTLSMERSVTIPSSAKITCSWSAWVSTPFVASTQENVLFWNGGGSSWSAGTNYYRYEIGQPADSIKTLFSVSGWAGASEGKKQTAYGTIRYDGRTNELWVPTTQGGWGTNYEYNWMNIVDAGTGELKESVPMKQYYWFPEMAVFPDKYAPEFGDIPTSVTLDGELKIALKDNLTDRDNLDVNIVAALSDAGNKDMVRAYIENDTLCIVPLTPGETSLTLTAQSNGVVSSQTIAVTVNGSVGIAEKQLTAGNFSVSGSTLRMDGYKGWQISVYSVEGIELARFTAQSDSETFALPQPTGAVVVKAVSGKTTVTKKLLRQ